jgi:hypothetical protein
MKKLQILIIFLALAFITPIPAMAGVRVGVNINLPPIAIGIGGPPDLVEIPDADQAYVAPDVNVDLFFWNGWWWRPYEGRWYRSHYYDRGWAHYNRAPGFYHHVDPRWRDNYRAHNWHGRPWDYQRVPGGHFQGQGQQGHGHGQGQQGHGQGRGQGHGQQGYEQQGQGQQGHNRN